MENLTNYCTTFPKQPKKEILFDVALQMIYDAFDGDRTMIFIKGKPFTGKTTLLSQFARKYSDKTFSFFIGKDYCTSSPQAFLSDICDQMIHCSYINRSGVWDEKIGTFDQDTLKTCFSSLYRDLKSAVKKGKGPFFFVIDGIQNLDQFEGETLRRLLPTGDDQGIYVLLSGDENTKYHYECEYLPVAKFSKDNLKDYFDDIEDLTDKDIDEIYNASGGVAGYIVEYKRQSEQNRNKDLKGNIPDNLTKLMERTWNASREKNIDFDMLAIITFSPEKINRNLLLDITGKKEDQLDDMIKKSQMIEVDETSGLLDLTIYKEFLMIKLKDFEDVANTAMIKYYLKEDNQEGAFTQLPIIYKRTSKYNDIVKLLTVENLVKQLTSPEGGLSLVRRNIKILIKMASESKDWSRVALFNLLDALITNILIEDPILENKIEALLSVDEYETALNEALRSSLPEDLLKLISPVCSYMQKKGLTLPPSAKKALNDAVDRMDNTIQLTPWIIDGLYNIAADLFSIDSNLGLKLLKKISKYDGNEIDNGNLVDMLCTKLAVNYNFEGEELETLKTLKTEIKNDSLREVALNAPSLILRMDTTGLFEQLKNIQDVSAKLFLLKAWCEEHKNEDNMSDVFFYAIQILYEDAGKTISIIYLRQFSIFILYFKNTEAVQKAIKLIDDLKETAIKSPKEEYARLEISLSEAENKFNIQGSVERFYSIYFECIEITELDVKCNILGRLLIGFHRVINGDNALYAEINNELKQSYKNLLDLSSEHFDAVYSLIIMLARYDHKLAVELAKKINLCDCRNNMFKEIARAYSCKTVSEIDFNFLIDLIYMITYIPLRDWLFTMVLRNLVLKDQNPDNKIIWILYDKLKNINNFKAMAICSACFMKWFKTDIRKVENLYSQMINSLEKISTKWARINIGYNIVNLLSTYDQDMAKKMIQYLSSDIFKGEYSEKRVLDTSVRTIKLSIKILKDLRNLSDFNDKLSLLEKNINKIPSAIDKMSLLCALAHLVLELNLNEKFNSIMKDCYKMIDDCQDNDTLSKLLFISAPLLFIYERSALFKKISVLSQYDKDRVLVNVIHYLINGILPDEDITSNQFTNRINSIIDARKFLEVLNHIKTDSMFSYGVEILVDALVEKKAMFKSKASLPEKHSLEIAETLKLQIDQKLPDEQNIKHRGYLIVCYGQITRLREAGADRAGKRWKEISFNWEEIESMVNNIANVSDKSLIYCLLSKNALYSNKGWCEKFVKAAENLLDYIPNQIDRSRRYYDVAKAYNDVSNKNSAEFLLKKSFELTQSIIHIKHKDEFLGKIIEEAYNISPNLANILATELDESTHNIHLGNIVNSMKLSNDPTKINKEKYISDRRILSRSLRKIYSSFQAGRLMLYNQDVLGKWVESVFGYDLETVNISINWYVENYLKSNTKATGELEILYTGLMKLVNTISKFETFLGVKQPAKEFQQEFYRSVDMEIFHYDENEKSMDFLKKWLIENVITYAKIYDPFFDANYLELLKVLKCDMRVTILLARKSKDVVDYMNDLSASWKSICDQSPESTRIYIYHTSSGKTPMHDRYIVTDKIGLQLGTSVNGLGKRETTIKPLNNDEKNKVEADLINPMILNPPREFGNEKLDYDCFRL
ncbi:AAA domain-containing protein [Propionispira arboris]|uniref:AAA domain-containing protein n=1 Tax=Propionispira arboris TaxID=84035 RepID=A0A1H7A4Y6_9FIRM|nr:ATP-binding protein [Propionispira arboris]SEJ60518.1 AAA domain-containing protein [Propionispira arboris]